MLEHVAAIRRKREPFAAPDRLYACGRPSCLHLTSDGAQLHIDADRTDPHASPQ